MLSLRGGDLISDIYKKQRAVVLLTIREAIHIKGFKALQKILFFINEVMEFGFTYRLYWFGPYSEDVEKIFLDLRYLNLVTYTEREPYPIISLNGLQINYINTIIEAYLDTQEIQKIGQIVHKLNKYSPTDLELLSTVYMIRKYNTNKREEIIKIVKRTKKIKDDRLILKAIRTLNSLKL